MKRLIFAAMLLVGLMTLASCGGGGGSSSGTTTTLDTDTTSDLSTAYTALETDERTAFTTILTNSDNADSQDVMVAISDAASAGLDSSDVRSAYTDSLSRVNPFTAGTASYTHYETLADALAALRGSNTTIFSAYTDLITGLDDTELSAVVAVIDKADEIGFDAFDTLAEAELTTIVASVPAASDAPTSVSGVVVDPYIEGAVFCVDENSNDECDTDEPVSTASDENGSFTFEEEPDDGSIILMKVAGEHNGVPYAFDGLAGVYEGGSIIVSPLTTMYAEGISAAQIAEMLTFAGLTGVTEETVLTDPMDGLLEGTTVDAENLALLRSSLASYMFMRIIEGSTTLSELSASEIYASAMDTNGAVYAILSTMATYLNSVLNENMLTYLEGQMTSLLSMGMPSLSFEDVVTVAVAIADKFSSIGYTTCNATSGTDEQKVTAALTAVETYATTTTNTNEMMDRLGSAFYLARVKGQLNAQYQSGVASANPAYGGYMNCESETFVLEDDGTISCYAE